MASLTRTIVLSLSAALTAAFVVIILRTVTLSAHNDDVAECKPLDSDFIRADPEIVKRFRTALQIQTVTEDDGGGNPEQLLRFRKFVQEAYPRVHSSPIVKFEVVSNYSLLYTVKGSDETLRPYMLISHFDVVPVNPAQWEEPPFSGKVTNGYIYGRGAIDDKHGVMGTYEALEYLLSTDFKPKRSLYIAFGHDEEARGTEGAKVMGELLTSRGVTDVEFLVDEGLTVIDGVIPGVDVPIGLIGTSEKGQVILELSTSSPAGHSSMPTRETCIGILTKAIARLENNPHPSMFGSGPEKGTFEQIAHEMKLPHRIAVTNLWLFSPIVSWMLSRSPASNAVTRTVTAVTRFNAGVKDNVLATEATAIVNHRIHPAQTVQQVIDYDREIINDDRVTIRVKYSMEPLPLSPYGEEDFGYQTIKTSIRQVFSGITVAPSVMVGNTDTRHYTHLTKNIYRFSPTYNYPEDLPRFHGNNERISIKNYEQAVNFYYHLMRNADRAGLDPIHRHGEDL